MRRLTLVAVLALALAACGGSRKSNQTLEITFGRTGGTMVPTSVTITPGGRLTGADHVVLKSNAISSAEDARLSQLVRNDFPSLESKQCPGTFPDESAMFITALGKTVTVRGGCEPGFTTLWNALTSAVGMS
jgi:hypothetical protein